MADALPWAGWKQILEDICFGRCIIQPRVETFGGVGEKSAFVRRL
jgi:hypothetical protein